MLGFDWLPQIKEVPPWFGHVCSDLSDNDKSPASFMVVDPSLTLSNHLDRERINVETSVLSVSAIPAKKILSTATMAVTQAVGA